MAFRERDYIKRQLAELARLIARALSLREAGRIDEAREELELGARTTLGVGCAPLGSVDVATAVALLRNPALAEAYAQLLEADAELADAADPRVVTLRARAAAVRAALQEQPELRSRPASRPCGGAGRAGPRDTPRGNA